jgi:hypothetical protein
LNLTRPRRGSTWLGPLQSGVGYHPFPNPANIREMAHDHELFCLADHVLN